MRLVDILVSFVQMDSQLETSATHAAQNLGYDSLKDLQMKVVITFIKGNDVFGVLTTGYGKSLCYACLPEMFDSILQPEEPSIVIVITPLTAIMDDQVYSRMIET